MSSSAGDPLRSSSTDRQFRDPALPPVEPPTASFILQLFLIPLTIVSIVVVLWLLFSWLAQMGRDDAATLVKDLERLDDNSWQRAYELADLLRSPDPKYDSLRHDPQLAGRLSKVLLTDLGVKAEDNSGGDVRVKRRMFLARALGSFETPEVLPALCAAAREERNAKEMEVRLSALEGLAVFASNDDAKDVRKNDEVMLTVLGASRATDENDVVGKTVEGDDSTYRAHAELRAVAAYTLGVIGGEQSIERLAEMVHDAYPSARYNAATGLARTGDERAVRVLREMLDPENEVSARDESDPRDRDRKRVNVVQTGVQSTVMLARANPQADIGSLKDSLQNLVDADMKLIKNDQSRLKNMAKEALHLLNQPAPAATKS